MITQERLKECLRYEPDTGFFFWIKKTGKKVVIGKRAGTPTEGYFVIGIDGKTYKLHRLAFLYVHGRLPKFVDHKDRDSTNNKINNLREATHSENMINRRAQINTTTGKCGVSPVNGRWRVRIKKDRKTITVGTFDSVEEAIAARVRVERQLFGEYAP